MRITRRILIVALIVLTALGWGWRAAPAQGDSQYLSETGHYVTGEFLSLYRSIPEWELIYGYPITEAFRDTETGLQVQYFQKARFELHPAEPAASRVQLTALGTELYEAGEPELALTNTTACRSFPGVRFQVCYTFLDFYDQHGGVVQFGYPISNMEQDNGVIVQYFERARLEWHPGLNGSSTVLLSNLGRAFFEDQNESPVLLLPVDPPGNAGIGLEPPVKTLKARAFPARAVTGRSGVQTIYVLVQDQRALPVAKADVTVTLYLPSGRTQPIIAPSTNPQGITQVEVPFRSDEVGMARVEVTVTSGVMRVLANTSFRIWW